jgi:hypothetical protein
MLELLRPLMHYKARRWNAAKREKLLDELNAFANDGVIVPRMRVSLAALKSLLPDVADRDLYIPADRIARDADFLFVSTNSLRESVEQIYPATVVGMENMPSWALNDVPLFVRCLDFLPDQIIDHRLAELALLLQSERRDAPERVRSLARDWTISVRIDSEYSSFVWAHLGTHTFEEITALAQKAGLSPESEWITPCVSSLQISFGQLIAAQQRSFPGMPMPTWAFASGSRSS